MKKRKSPFGMIAVLAILFVVVIMVNARSHAEPPTAAEQAAAAQSDSKAPTSAPSASTLSNQLKDQVKGAKPTPKVAKGPKKRDPSRPSIVNPYAEDTSAAPKAKPKLDPSSGVQGGWYQKDSALNDNK